MATCPICGLDNIADETDRCPQCDADLESFRILDSLPEKKGAPVKRSGAGWYVILFLIAGVLVLLNVYQYFRLEDLELKVSDQKIFVSNSVSQMYARIESVADSADKADKAATPIEKSESAESANTRDTVAEPVETFFTYESTKTDTLWDVSQRYYGSGIYYPVLLEHNPHAFVYRIGRGVRLNVLKDPCRAPEIYEKIVLRDGGGTFWRYTVQAGDSFESVSIRFYKTTDAGKMRELRTDNPGPFPEPGKKIRIRLE